MKAKYNIFIVEDHEVFRLGIRELINQEGDFVICGEADNIHDAWQKIKQIMPDIVIVDISLKDSNGLILIQDLHRYNKNLPTLVLSMYEEDIYAERSLSVGARGYIMKQETSESIIKAIRSILEGNMYVSEKIKNRLLQKISKTADTSFIDPVTVLTNRELEVFRLIGNGYSSGKISEILNLNVKTIGTYKERIKEKLQIGSGNELIKYASLWVENNLK